MKVTTTKGREIDIAALRENYGTARAIGNTNMNARGDIVDRSGRVIKTTEAIADEYYESANAAKDISTVSLRDISDEVFMTPDQVMKALGEQSEAKPEPKVRRKSRESED